MTQGIKSITAEEDRGFGIRPIAIELAKSGAYLEAISLAKSLDEDYSVTEVSHALAESGQFGLALSVARQLETPSAFALRRIADMMIGIDNQWARTILNEALSVARANTELAGQANDLTYIGQTMARVQDAQFGEVLIEAHERARQIPELSTRANCLYRLARVLTEMGDSRSDNVFREAIEAARATDDVKDRVRTLADIGLHMHLANHAGAESAFSESFGELTLALNLEDRDILLENVIDLLTIAERFDQAITATQDYSPIAVTGSIAIGFARAGRFTEALDFARRIERGEDYDYALSHLAEVFVAMGRIEDALNFTNEIEENCWHLNALRAIGIALAASGRPDDALQAMQRSRHTSSELKHSFDYWETWAEIAASYFRMGKIKEGIAVVPSLAIDDYLNTLCVWQPSLTTFAPDLFPKAIREALRIIMWEYPLWQPVYDSLTTIS